MEQKLSFGLYLLDQKRLLGPALGIFCQWLGDRLGATVVPEEVADYEALAEHMRAGSLDIAWLPPIVFLRVGEEAVVPVAAMRRTASGGGYETALVVREDSPFRGVEDLRGASVAWVDAWSAAGYVIPRLRLRLGGIDPLRHFGAEAFYGSHTAAVRAVAEGEADVAGTYARTDAAGNAVGGAWSELPDLAPIRTLMTFGEIPPDVIAVGRAVPPDVRERLRVALDEAATSTALRPLVKEIFGADAFVPVALAAYDGLRAALSIAETPPAKK